MEKRHAAATLHVFPPAQLGPDEPSTKRPARGGGTRSHPKDGSKADGDSGYFGVLAVVTKHIEFSSDLNLSKIFGTSCQRRNDDQLAQRRRRELVSCVSQVLLD